MAGVDTKMLWTLQADIEDDFHYQLNRQHMGDLVKDLKQSVSKGEKNTNFILLFNPIILIRFLHTGPGAVE